MTFFKASALLIGLFWQIAGCISRKDRQPGQRIVDRIGSTNAERPIASPGIRAFGCWVRARLRPMYRCNVLCVAIWPVPATSFIHTLCGATVGGRPTSQGICAVAVAAMGYDAHCG